MKTVKIHFIYPAHGIEDIPLMEQLTTKFNFVFDAQNPDYVFAKEYTFFDKRQLDALKHYKEKGAICIFYAGECISPDLNIFDYAFVYDDDLKSGDRCIRIPTTVFFHSDLDNEEFITHHNQNPREILKTKTDFCNFIYGNANAHPNRDKLFYKISEYKHVDSLGRHLKNKDVPDTRCEKNWAALSVQLKNPYKFSIAAENAHFHGYTSEKLLTSLLANTVPIYWGNPNVVRDFNPKAFINCNDYPNFDAVLERVKEIDNDDDLWCEIVSQPRRTAEQIALYEKDKRDYMSFIENIFAQDKESARRAPQGFWPDNYCEWFFNSLSNSTSKDVTKSLCVFKKIRKPNGRRHIYLFGIKVLSYKKKQKKHNQHGK